MLLLPYCEFQPIYDLINFNVLMSDSTGTAPNRNIDQIALPLNLFKCPSSGDVNLSAVFRCAGPGSTVSLFGAAGDMADSTVTRAVSNYLANSGMPNLSAAPPLPGLSDGIGTYNPALGNVNSINQTTNGPVDNGGVMFEDSRIRIADITDGTSNTALLAEHKGATCSTGSTNTICTEQSGTVCYAYWASADATAGGETSGNTVASDVDFTPLFGINGSGLGWTGAATIAAGSELDLPRRLPRRHQLAARSGCPDRVGRRLGPLRQPEHSGHWQRERSARPVPALQPVGPPSLLLAATVSGIATALV